MAGDRAYDPTCSSGHATQPVEPVQPASPALPSADGSRSTHNPPISAVRHSVQASMAFPPEREPRNLYPPRLHDPLFVYSAAGAMFACFLFVLRSLDWRGAGSPLWCGALRARWLAGALLFAHLQVMRFVLFFAPKSLGGLARIGWLGQRGGAPIWAVRDPLF